MSNDRVVMRILKPKAGQHHLKIVLVACGACLLSQIGIGQQQPLTPDAINWKAGPAKVVVADAVRVNIPEGYKFVDKDGARAVLERMKNPVSKNLVGILAPSSAKWFMVLEYSDIGYVNDRDKDRLDTTAMLKSARRMIARQNQENLVGPMPGAASAVVEWELKPVYYSAEHKLEWAIRLGNPSEAVVNYTVRFFGRRGVLDATAVQKYKSDLDLTPLRKATQEMLFLEGQRYADYKPGDKLAGFSLAQLAANENAWDLASLSSGGHSGLLMGIIVTFLVLVGLVWGGVAIRKAWLQEVHRAQSSEKNSAMRNGDGELRAPSVSQTKPVSREAVTAHMAKANSHPQDVSIQKPVSEWKVRKPKRGGRKRQFNFDAYYSEMIMSLTSGSYGEPQPLVSLVNGKSKDTNGVATNSGTDHTASTINAEMLLKEASQLIEGQQKLIAGQKRFIDEQSRLIEEKHKLIDAETRILEKQAELFDERLF
jgi:uncharacterized membrane-anchored protein